MNSGMLENLDMVNKYLLKHWYCGNMMQEIGFVLKMLILSSAYINCFSYVLVSDGDGLGCPGRGRILGEKKRGVY